MIFAFRPFQDNIGPALKMEGKKPFIQFFALRLQHPTNHLYARLLKLFNPSSVDLVKWIPAPNHYAWNVKPHNQVGTGRCLRKCAQGSKET